MSADISRSDPAMLTRLKLKETRLKMTTMRRRVFIACALPIVVLLAACGESKSLKTTSATTTSVSSGLVATVPTGVPTTTITAPETTVATTVPFKFTETTPPLTLPPTTPPTVPTATEPPTIPPTIPPVTAAPTTTISPIAIDLGPVTNLKVPPAAEVISLPAAVANCTLDPGLVGYVTVECAKAVSYGNGMVVLIQRAAADNRFRVMVFFKKADPSLDYESRYIAIEPAIGAWTNVHAEVADHNGDTFAEAWIGYRYAGTGGYLDLDVLDPRSDGSFYLAGLRELPKGRIDVRDGGADVVSATDATNQTFLVQLIGRSGTQWRINAGTMFPADTAPLIAGDFP
jgi:hypothetical protein